MYMATESAGSCYSMHDAEPGQGADDESANAMWAIHIYHFKCLISCGSSKRALLSKSGGLPSVHPKSLIEHSSFISKRRNFHLSVKMRVILDRIHSLELQGSKPLLLLKHSLRKGEEGLGPFLLETSSAK